ncbi:uncharacterized protein LOC142323107 isoform X2 [Lycorma delicatula]|uniref:uncharacterized protein LOC142323107 isoform X2 n=1 Tax=Lycorma delicatula TaxID=130591 RepID=UPI003F50E3C8
MVNMRNKPLSGEDFVEPYVVDANEEMDEELFDHDNIEVWDQIIAAVHLVNNMDMYLPNPSESPIMPPDLEMVNTTNLSVTYGPLSAATAATLASSGFSSPYQMPERHSIRLNYSSSIPPAKENLNAGRKRRRVQANNRYLSQLSSSDSEDDEPQLTSSTGSKFSVLFEDEESLEVWNNFMQCSEEVQNALLQEPSKKRRKQKKKNTKNKKIKRASTNDYISGEDAFNNLSDTQMAMFENRDLPLGMVEYLENTIIEHFEASPQDTFISPPLSGFERLMVHGIAAYYALDSESFDCPYSSGRVTVVTNDGDDFERPIITLSSHLVNKHAQQRPGRNC